MVDSGFGRTDLPQLGKGRVETRRGAEADDGRVRHPGTPLRLVQAERLEPAVQVRGEGGRAALRLGEDEHPDTPRLAVAAERKGGRRGRRSGLAQAARDSL